MLTNHRAVTQHDLALSWRQIGVEKRPHGAMVIRKAEILAFRFFCGAQAVSGRFQSRVGFGEFAKGEHDPSQHLLGQVVEEIALVLATVEPPQQLMPPMLTAMADPGVMACGNPGQPPFLGGPVEHRPELHRTVALGAGQGRDAVAVAVHQPLHDLLLKGLPGVHHVMGDAELFADSGCIHETFGATGAFTTHQPKGEALHLPARFDQQCCGQGTVHSTGQTNGDAVLARPSPQPLQCCISCCGGKAIS